MTAALITRETSDLLGSASAVFSPDEVYRYLLTRTWDDAGPVVTWAMLNPSKATETASDPTITRCIRFSRSWGYGGLAVVNLYGLRSTDPAVLAGHPDPVGPDNDRMISLACEQSALVVAAWGTGFLQPDRIAAVAAIIAASGRTLRCLKVTKGGHPWHPLYVRGDATPVPYELPGSLS